MATINKILHACWQGIKVWSVLISLGVLPVLRTIFHNFFNGWTFFNQFWFFVGLFLVILGILAAIISYRSKLETKPKPVDLPQLSPEEIVSKKTSDWLQEVLAFNKNNIPMLVNGCIARWNFVGLKTTGAPFFEVHFQLFNLSIFTLDFNGVGGSINVGKVACTIKPTANSPQRRILQGTELYVIVTQGVFPEMAKNILQAGADKEKLNFDLSRLTLDIETTTEGFKGLKPYIKFDSDLAPDIATWLELQGSHKIGYWT